MNTDSLNKPDPMAEDDKKINAILAMYANWLQQGGGSDKFRMDDQEAKAAINAYTTNKIIEARIDENQRRLDKLEAWHNRKPVPGELTTASFGSAGAAMEVAGFERSFNDRIEELRKTL